MCLAVISTSHPDYALILISNRDEYLNRKTLPADWWESPHSHVLGGRDLQRDAQGTWLGITKQGRIALLTNFREEEQTAADGARSRGEIAKAYLTTPSGSTETPEMFVERLLEEGVQGVGGFSLLFGQLHEPHTGKRRARLGIVSNRTPDVHGISWVAGEDEAGSTLGQACSLSNTAYGDRKWPKVVDGEESLQEAVDWSIRHQTTEAELIDKCFEVLSIDTLPKPRPDEQFEVFIRQLRNSIFIPAIGSPETTRMPADDVASADTNKPIESGVGTYGTQKQTVLLVGQDGQATFIERTLYDDDAQPTDADTRDRRYDFQIDR